MRLDRGYISLQAKQFQRQNQPTTTIMAQPLQHQVNYSQEELILCDHKFIAHPSGALIWLTAETLIVADLYLRSGFTWSVMTQLGTKTQASNQINTIKTLINTYPIKQVIALGRSFRRLDDPYHLDNHDLNTLYNLQKQVDWLWVAGPMARQYPSLVGGIRLVKYEQQNFIFRAMPRKVPVSHEIAAGMYPMVKIAKESAGQSQINQQDTTNPDIISAPAFVTNRKRLLMPAFGGKLAARNLLGDEFLPILGYDDLMVQVMDKFRTYPVSKTALLADEPSGKQTFANKT